MAARKTTKRKSPPPKKPRTPARKSVTKRPARKRPAKKHLLPVPDSRDAALAWFANLSNRIADAGVAELQALVAEARTYDLVGLGEALGDDQQVLELNRAANQLITAALDTVGVGTAQGFQLQVLRDILNDS